jgi:hypothetical protein
MNKSTKFLLASVSPVALAAGWAMLDSAPAHATVTVAGTLVTYASENFIGASAASIVTVSGSALRVVTGNTTTDFVSGFMTFTLSNGATFTAAPTPTTVNVTLSSATLLTGSTAVVYTNSSQTTTSAAITLGSFSIGGVGTRLATSAQNINITYASSASNVPAVAVATLAVGVQAYSFSTNSTAVTVDLANTGQGLVFRATNNSSNVTFATLGQFTVNAAATSVEINGTTQFTAGSTDVLRAVVAGNLSGFASMYAATATTCAATPPSGGVAATLTSTSATFSPLVLGSTYTICGVANGTTVVPAGVITAVSNFAFVARTSGVTTYTPGNYAMTASTIGTLSFNGSSATAFYVVGLGSYISAIRVTNTSTSSGSLFVSVTPDTTGTPVRGLLDSTLLAGQSKFYLSSDIRNAVGTSVLADSSNRATVVFLSSFDAMKVQNFIVNPGGVLSGGTSVTTGNTTGN